MQPLILGAQKEKLLLMCSVLFTEYKEIKLIDIGSDDNIFCVLSLEDKYGDIVLCHWFEFLLKHIMPIAVLKGKIGITITRTFCCTLPNPIDYIYDKYFK